MNVRISMTERLAVDANGSRLDEQRFPGRQGRVVFAYLALQNGRPVPREELAEVLWGEELPATWQKGIRVLMTKLRALLEECGIDRSTGLTSAFGCYQLTLPADTWIDVHAAASTVERAEAALAAGDLEEARAQGSEAAVLSRPTFLPGEDGSWVEEQRRDLRDLLVRALKCLRDASFAGEEFEDAVRYAAEITELEPFRESSYRALMQAHVAAGDPAEALRVYEHCRHFLADELGAYPSPETEAVYREILQSSPGTSAGRVDRSEETGLEAESPSPPPPPPYDVPPRRSRRRTFALASVALLVAVLGTAAGLDLSAGAKPPVRIVPNSLVRLDSSTLKPTKVVPIDPKADLVVASGGYIWVTHGILHYTDSSDRRNAGDNRLTRIDPSTDEAETIGGVAPCGITPDPSGDVWVGNCYPPGQGGNVERIDAKTGKFGKPLTVPTRAGYFRGMQYASGSLWVSGVCCHPDRRLFQLNPETRKTRTIHLKRPAIVLARSDGYEDLWMTNRGGVVSRMDVETKKVRSTAVTNAPSALAVNDGVVWVVDWEVPTVTRLPADGTGRPRPIHLHVPPHTGGVTSIAAGDGAIWVTVPDLHALIRIDPKTYHQRKIPLRYAPWGVAVDEHGAIWVTLRWRNTFGCQIAGCGRSG